MMIKNSAQPSPAQIGGGEEEEDKSEIQKERMR